jgi:hypothetical protein
MRLPPTAPPADHFVNAPGSKVPEQFAIEARKNPDAIKYMGETKKEISDLEKEALCRQYVIIVDRSGSMGCPDGRGTRWDSAGKAVEKLVETVFKYDTDHIVPLYLFDDKVEFIGECTKTSQVTNIFKTYGPRGTTDLAKCLDEALKTYSGTKRPNYEIVPGTTFIVILDGSSDDNEAVKTVIRHYAEPQNGYIANHTQIAISFIQIGDDSGATRFLQDLDDNMKGGPDIVDTKKDDILSESGGIDRVLYDAIFD